MRKRERHGMCKTHEYQTWADMKTRCNNKNHKWYYCYGDRGISVSDEWLSFTNFFRDMGPKPKGTSLDRINNDEGYSKDNCRWATSHEQNRNHRRNRLATFLGETLTFTDWAIRLGYKNNSSVGCNISRYVDLGVPFWKIYLMRKGVILG